MQAAEYEHIARVQASHWWYAATRALLRDILLPRIRAAADAQRPLRFLDVGAGTGATSAWLADRGALFALDRSPLALAWQPRARPSSHLIRGDACRLPIRSDTIDFALSVTVLYHSWVGDAGAAVREMTRTLRPGGHLCLFEPGIRSLRRSHDRETATARRFALGDLVQLTRQAGLETERATGAYAFLAPLALMKAAIERGTAASDLDTGGRAATAVLARLAQVERRLLRRRDLPFGLSVIVLARKPTGPGALPSVGTDPISTPLP